MLIADEYKQILYMRAEMVISNLRFCCNAADVHEVANLRSTALMLMEAVSNDSIELTAALDVLRRVELKQVEFFQKKHAHFMEGRKK